jgi:hypothetical protein
MILLRRRDKNIPITWAYQDYPFTAGELKDNTNQLAREFGILPALAAKALDLLFPWDYTP